MAETTENRHQINKKSESEVLIKVAQTASSALELREILDTISLIVANTLRKDICSICIFKPENKVICIQAASNIERESINVFCLIDKDETISRMFSNLEPLVVNDLRDSPEIRETFSAEANDMLSMLAVPVIRDNTPIGILMVHSRDPHIYGQDEIDLLTIISHNISSAIQNAELYRNVKSQLDELRVIHEIGQTVTEKLGGRRVIDSVSSLFIDFELPSVQRFLAQIARTASSYGGVTTVLILEAGSISDKEENNIKYLMDVVVELKYDGSRMARVTNMKWSKFSRDWIPIPEN